MLDYVLILLIASVISFMASMAVVLTYMCFQRMRSKLFVMIIAFISIGDAIGNFPYMFPYRPHTGDWWCSISAFMSLAGYPMGWLWTVALVYWLYSLGTIGKICDDLITLHCLCWGVPILLAFLTLVFTRYTQGSEIDVCSIDSSEKSELYHFISYFGLLTLSLVAMFIFFLKLQLLYRRNDMNVTSNAFMIARSALQWYPSSLFIFWLPHLVTEFCFLAGLYTNEIFLKVYYAFVVWKSLHGLAAAVVFFSKSKEARTLWWDLTISRYFQRQDGSIDDLSTRDTEFVVTSSMFGAPPNMSTVTNISNPIASASIARPSVQQFSSV